MKKLEWEDNALNAGAQATLDAVIRIEPLEPIFTITHFVRIPLLRNSCPANIGSSMPVNSSACNAKQ